MSRSRGYRRDRGQSIGKPQLSKPGDRQRMLWRRIGGVKQREGFEVASFSGEFNPFFLESGIFEPCNGGKVMRLENIATKRSKLERRGIMASINVRLYLSQAFLASVNAITQCGSWRLKHCQEPH